MSSQIDELVSQIENSFKQLSKVDMQIKITVKVKRHFCKCCFDY